MICKVKVDTHSMQELEDRINKAQSEYDSALKEHNETYNSWNVVASEFDRFNASINALTRDTLPGELIELRRAHMKCCEAYRKYAAAVNRLTTAVSGLHSLGIFPTRESLLLY